MNFKTTYVLFAAVAAVLVVFILVLSLTPRGDSEDFVFASVREAARTADARRDYQKGVSRIEIERTQPSGETLALERQDETRWKLVAPYEATVDSAVVEQLLTSLLDLRIDRTAEVTSSLEQFGLDKPSAVVALTKGNDKLRLALGKVSAGNNPVVFVTSSDRPKDPMAVKKTGLAGLFRGESEASVAGELVKGITDFRPRTLLADGSFAPWDTVGAITVTREQKTLALIRKNDAGWRFEKPEGYGDAELEGSDPNVPLAGVVTPIGGVKPLLSALAGLRMPPSSEVVEEVTDFARYDLVPGKEFLRIEMTRRAEGMPPEVLLVGKFADDKQQSRFVRVGTERFVAKLSARVFENVEKVVANPGGLRDRTLINLPRESIDAIDINSTAEKVELRRYGTPSAWRVAVAGTPTLDPAGSVAVYRYLEALMPSQPAQRRMVRDFPDSSDDKALGLDPPAVEVLLWSSGVVPEEKKDEKDEKDAQAPAKLGPLPRPALKGAATVSLKFGKKDKDVVYVRRTSGGFSQVLALPAGLLDAATKTEADFVDPIPPSFRTAKATKLSFNRGSDTFEVEKEKADDPVSPWKLKVPAELAGRTADPLKVQNVLGHLSALMVTKVVAKKASDKELERMGLKPARVEATVALADDPAQFAVAFGVEGDDKETVYAKVAGSDKVYLVRKTALDATQQGELIDPTVFKFDPSKVKAIELTGWKDVVGAPVTHEYERAKPGEWTAKVPAGFAVNGPEVEKFVAALQTVRADKFLRYKGGPTPAEKLDAASGGMEMKLTVDGEATPIVLVVGAADDTGKSVFARSNRAEGAVFLLPKAPFDAVRGKPAHFQK